MRGRDHNLNTTEARTAPVDSSASSSASSTRMVPESRTEEQPAAREGDRYACQRAASPRWEIHRYNRNEQPAREPEHAERGRRVTRTYLRNVLRNSSNVYAQEQRSACTCWLTRLNVLPLLEVVQRRVPARRESKHGVDSVLGVRTSRPERRSSD